jgi:hypothetical protein
MQVSTGRERFLSEAAVRRPNVAAVSSSVPLAAAAAVEVAGVVAAAACGAGFGWLVGGFAWALFLGGGGGLVFAVAVLVWRPVREEWAEFHHEVAAVRDVPVNGRPVPVERAAYTLINGGFRYTLSGRQLDTLHRWYLDGYEVLRRDRDEAGRGLGVLGVGSALYRPLINALYVKGFIDGDNRWLPAGVRLLAESSSSSSSGGSTAVGDGSAGG